MSANPSPDIVLVHSPLVGPLTWALVSRALRRRGIGTLLPVLPAEAGGKTPYWVRHASAVARRLESLETDSEIVLVGHSGAGPLLPAIGAFSPHPVTGYIFVDAGLPHPGRSVLEEIEAGLPEFGRELRRDLETGGSFPNWTDEVLRDIVPDAGLREGLLAELQPRGLPYFTEPMPQIDGWPDAPCAYVLLSEAYAGAAQEARRLGWPCREFEAGHFHMLVDPKSVAEAIVELASPVNTVQRSVADMSFGAIPPRKRPEDFTELRDLYMDAATERDERGKRST